MVQIILMIIISIMIRQVTDSMQLGIAVFAFMFWLDFILTIKLKELTENNNE